jgi:hypothetical protein
MFIERISKVKTKERKKAKSLDYNR